MLHQPGAPHPGQKKKHRRKFLTQQHPSLKEPPSRNRGGPGGSPPGGGLGAEPPVYGGELFRKKYKILKDRAFFRHFFRHRFRQKTTPWTENGPQFQSLDHGGGSAVCALSTPKK